MKVIQATASSALLLVLAGCAVFKGPDAEPPAAEGGPAVSAPAEPEESVQPPPVERVRPVAPVPEAERLLEYFRQLRRLGSGELGREHEAVRTAYARSRSDFDRMRLAMVLSLPESSLNDGARALELLEPMLRNQQSPLHALALLLHTFVQEQRRLERHVQGMQQKLDALKAMERDLIERKR